MTIEEGAKSPSRAAGSLKSYEVGGLLIFLLAEAVIVLGLGSTSGPLSILFLWAYMKVALLELLVYGAPYWLQTLMLLFSYLVLGGLLWFVLESPRRGRPPQLWRILFGWLFVEASVLILGVTLLRKGIIAME